MDYTAPTAPLPRPPRRPFRWLKRLVTTAAVTVAVLAVVVSAARYVLLLKARARTAEVVALLDRDDPGWRLEQIEAACKVIPDERNSAIPLRAASRLIPKDWPRIRPTMPPKSDLPKGPDLPRSTEALIETSSVFSPDEAQVAALRTELTALGPALAEARKVVDMPEGRYAIAWTVDPFATLLPDQQAARNTARLLKLDAILRAHEGDIDGSLESCRAILNVARSIGDEPFAIIQIVRIAIGRVALRAIEHVLSVGEPSEQALAKVQTLLESEEAESLLRSALRGERSILDAFYARLASGELTKMGGEGWPPAVQWLWGEFMVTHPRGVVLEEMNSLIPIADAPLSSQRELYLDWEKGFAIRAKASSLDKFSRLLMPAIYPLLEFHVVSHARLRAAIITVAAERYRRKNGRWPESGEQLTPWPLAYVPDDAHTDNALIWDRSGETLTIYSTGPDLVDNGGLLEDDPDPPALTPKKSRQGSAYWDQRDVGFRLHDVDRRKQDKS